MDLGIRQNIGDGACIEMGTSNFLADRFAAWGIECTPDMEIMIQEAVMAVNAMLHEFEILDDHNQIEVEYHFK